MSATIHEEAYFAASGGPGVELPSIDTAVDETNAPTTILFDHADQKWKVTDPFNGVYVEADNPRELIDWVDEYLETLGGMKDAGEI